MNTLQIIGIAIFGVGCVLYLVRAIKSEKPTFDKWTFTAVICFLVGLALIAIPAVMNPETCSTCEAVLQDAYEFCPYCGTPK